LEDATVLNALDIPNDLFQLHKPEEIEIFEFNVFKLCVGFYIGILQRAHNRSLLPQTLNLIKGYINKSIKCASWLIEEFCNELLIEENLLQSPQKEMRRFITGLLYCAMLKVYPLERTKLNLYWT